MVPLPNAGTLILAPETSLLKLMARAAVPYLGTMFMLLHPLLLLLSAARSAHLEGGGHTSVARDAA